MVCKIIFQRGAATINFFSLVHFSRSVVSYSLQPHESQHARPPCPSPTPRVQPNSCPSSRWCHPAISSSVIPFSSCPQCLPASVFSNESVLCIRWPKYWSFSFSIIPSKEHPGLISFKMDWWDLLAVQGTLKSLLQHHSSKASILQCSAFFTVQLSHPYTTTGKTIASDFLVMSKNSYVLTINIFSKKSSFLSSLLFFDWCSRQKKHKHDFLLIAFLFYFSSSCPHEDYIFSLGPFSLIFPRPWLYLRGLLNIEVRRSSIA